MLNVMPEIALNQPRVGSLIGQREAACMPQQVRMRDDRQPTFVL